MIASLAFIAFALLHSLTASGAFKSFLARVFGQEAINRHYRLAFNIFSAAITAAAACIILSQPDVSLYRPPWYVLWPAHIVQISGVFLLAAAFRPFDLGSFLGTSRARDKKTELETSGVYGLVRHPMYLAGILVFVFEPNVTANCLAVSCLGTAYFVYGALVEEKRLAGEFGERYIEYKKRVPMFNIIAGIIHWKRRRDV